MLRRRTLLAAPAIVSAGLARSAYAQSPATLRIVPQADLAILDPTLTTATVTRNHAFMVFDTLYALDAAGRPVPEMAAGHTTSDDGRIWTITLRPGMRFHDGAPILASDCTASLVRWARRDPFGKTLMAATEALEAPDDRTIRFRLRAPFPLLPLALAKSIPSCPMMMPARIIPPDAAAPVTEMVGSGPFRFLAAERVPGARVAYARNPDYSPSPHGAPGLSSGPKRALVDRVEWHVIPDPATALAALRRGEVDWWERPIPDLIPAARADRALAVEVTNTSGTYAFVQLNHLHPPFDNPAIRRILLSAIDQREFTQAAGGSDPALQGGQVGLFLPGGPMASTAGLEALAARTDYPALRAELAAAGYGGERTVLLQATDSPVNNAVSEVMADLLRKLGFNLDTVTADWASVVQRRTSQATVGAGGWSLFGVSADGDYFADPTVHPAIRANGRQAWIGWPTSPRLEALFAAWFAAPDLPTRQSIAADMQRQAMIDVPYIPAGQVFLPTIHRRTVTGILPGFTKFWNVAKA